MKTKIIMMLMFFALFTGCKEKQKSTSSQQESTHESEIENSQVSEPQDSVALVFTQEQWQSIVKGLTHELGLELTPEDINQLFVALGDTDPDEIELFGCSSSIIEGVGQLSLYEKEVYCSDDRGNRRIRAHIIPNTSEVIVIIDPLEGFDSDPEIRFFAYNRANEKLSRIPTEQRMQALRIQNFLKDDFPHALLDNAYIDYRVEDDLIYAALRLGDLSLEHRYSFPKFVDYNERILKWNGEKFVILVLEMDTPERKTFVAYCTDMFNLSEKEAKDFYNGKNTELHEKEIYGILSLYQNPIRLFKERYGDYDAPRTFYDWVYLQKTGGNALCLSIYSPDANEEEKQILIMYEYDEQSQTLVEIEQIDQYFGDLMNISASEFYDLDVLGSQELDIVNNDVLLNYTLHADNNNIYIYVSFVLPAEFRRSENFSNAYKYDSYVYYRWNGKAFIRDYDYHPAS